MTNTDLKSQIKLAYATKEALTLKTVLCAIAAAVTLIISFFPLAATIGGIAGAVFCALIYAFCFHEINDGVLSLFKGEPSNDTFTAFALISAFMQSVFLTFFGGANARLFSWTAFLCCGFSMMMKLLYVNEIIRNLAYVGGSDVYSVDIANCDLPKRYISSVFIANPVVTFPDIFDETYEGDPSEDKNRLFVPVVSAAVALVSVIALIIYGFDTFFVSLCALFSICVGFTGETAFVLPYITAQRKLREAGSILVGANSIEALRDAQTLAIRDTDIFSSENVEITDMKFANEAHMARAMEFIAVMLRACKSPLAEPFFEMLKCEESTLPEISDIAFVHDYGVRGEFCGKQILLGNRNLLLSYEIKPMSIEKEASVISSGQNILYLAVNGRLTAAMSVRYGADKRIKEIADSVGEKFNLIVETLDCCINEHMVTRAYDLKNTRVIVTDNAETEALKRAREIVAERKRPAMLSSRSALGILSSMRKASSLSKIIETSILTRSVSVVIGLLLTAFAVFAVPAALNPFWILIFNLVWMLPTIGLSYLNK